MKKGTKPMNEQKVKEAQKILGKIQGILWALNKLVEYRRFEEANDRQKVLKKLYDDIFKLNLTEEEMAFANNNIDYDIAEKYYWEYR